MSDFGKEGGSFPPQNAEKTPILFHPDTGYVFIDGRMQQLPQGSRREITHAFARDGHVSSKDIKDIIQENGSSRTTGTVLRELNMWYAGSTPESYDPKNALFSYDRNVPTSQIQYTANREIQIITADQLDGLADALGTKPTRTPQGGATIRSSNSKEAKEEEIEDRIKVLSEKFGLYEFQGRKVKVTAGLQLAEWMLLTASPMRWIDEKDLLSLIPEGTEQQKKQQMKYVFNNIREKFRGGLVKDTKKTPIIQNRRADRGETKRYEYRIGIPVDKEKPSHPSILSSYQATVIGSILVHRDGLPIQIGNDIGNFSVNGLGEIHAKLEDQVAEPLPNIPADQQRRDALMNIDLFLKVDPVEQEQFIRRHPQEVRDLLRWVRDENERGQLQGALYYFLTVEPSTRTQTELYQNPQVKRRWVAPPEGIASSYIKRKQREARKNEGQELLVAFD